MGMDLVPVYEEEGEEKEPASTIRIDPVTMQNMGVRLGRVQRKLLTKDIRTVGSSAAGLKSFTSISLGKT
jgi:Cu(I)/Ag(I) efflux system membrane fusion protein/cobalt-zinc-cadmium efflux system membrane fusion protein